MWIFGQILWSDADQNFTICTPLLTDMMPALDRLCQPAFLTSYLAWPPTKLSRAAAVATSGPWFCLRQRSFDKWKAKLLINVSNCSTTVLVYSALLNICQLLKPTHSVGQLVCSPRSGAAMHRHFMTTSVHRFWCKVNSLIAATAMS